MFNQVLLVGRMTKDPDLRYTPEGIAVSNFTIAMNRPFKSSSGDYEADFVQCHTWRKLAENTATYCQKGSLVAVSGRIQTRNFESQEGNRIFVTEVVVERIRFLDRKSNSNETEQSSSDLMFEVDPLLVKE